MQLTAKTTSTHVERCGIDFLQQKRNIYVYRAMMITIIIRENHMNARHDI